jgi:multiple sugar transport system ATP-binding protein
LSNLDAKMRVQMRAEIKELHQRLKTTTVYVIDDQIETMKMADRIVVLRGRNRADRGVLELYDRPANLFVAGLRSSRCSAYAHDGEAGIDVANDAGYRVSAFFDEKTEARRA